MLIGIVIYSAFTLLTAVSVGFGDMFVYRALSGVGESMQNAALFSAVGAYFFANRAMALGSLNFAYGLGGFLGPLLGADGGLRWVAGAVLRLRPHRAGFRRRDRHLHPQTIHRAG